LAQRDDAASRYFQHWLIGEFASIPASFPLSHRWDHVQMMRGSIAIVNEMEF
jgi:hypothetical protein